MSDFPTRATAATDGQVVVPSRYKMQLEICRALGVDPKAMGLDDPAATDELPPNTCPHCRGKGTLPGRNWVAQGYVEPNCWHCNGLGVVTPPTQPEWAK